MDVGENMREIGSGTVITISEDCYTQQLAFADKWTSGVSLQKEAEARMKMSQLLIIKNKEKKCFNRFSLFHAIRPHLANSFFLFVERAEHVMSVEVLLPLFLALKVELLLLCGLPQYI